MGCILPRGMRLDCSSIPGVRTCSTRSGSAERQPTSSLSVLLLKCSIAAHQTQWKSPVKAGKKCGDSKDMVYFTLRGILENRLKKLPSVHHCSFPSASLRAHLRPPGPLLCCWFRNHWLHGKGRSKWGQSQNGCERMGTGNISKILH